jgi:hypothetical protein
MRHIIPAVTTATALISLGALSNGAKAADLYPTPEPVPPAAEAPPPAAIAPPPVAVVPQAPAVVLVEPRCPVVRQCGYWGCGWRAACAPVGADVYYRGYAGPRWGYYGGYYRPHWGHQHWGYHRHWSG